MDTLPDPHAIFPNAYHTSCFIKNVITAPNISVGDYTYYDDPKHPTNLSATMCSLITRSLAIT